MKKAHETPRHSISLIIAAVCKVTEIPADIIKSLDRSQDVVIARDIAIGLIYSQHRISLKKLGEIFGGRNHSTISYSRDKFLDIKERPALDPRFSNKLNKVLTLLN